MTYYLSVEHLFSSGGEIFTARHNELSEIMFHKLTYVAQTEQAIQRLLNILSNA